MKDSDMKLREHSCVHLFGPAFSAVKHLPVGYSVTSMRDAAYRNILEG